MHLLCFWENVVKFWDLVVFNSYNYPQHIRCVCSMKVASSPLTFREQNECFANTIFFHSNKVKLLLSRFRQHHLVSTATEAKRSRPRCSVSSHMTNVVKWPNVITNYLENDNVMLPKLREKRFRESSPCFCGINFFFPKNVRETTFELNFGCESVSVKERVWNSINPRLTPPPLFSGKECFYLPPLLSLPSAPPSFLHDGLNQLITKQNFMLTDPVWLFTWWKLTFVFNLWLRAACLSFSTLCSTSYKELIPPFPILNNPL